LMLTGNPTRQDLYDVKTKRQQALEFFGLNLTQKVILVIGGSLGARVINESIAAGLTKFVDNDIQLLWQTGKTYYSTAQIQLKDIDNINLNAFEFISRMDLAYAAADIVISRAGASSVSELCNIGMAAILVPSPNVAEDHQTSNAMALVGKQAALLVEDKNASVELVNTALALCNDESKQQSLRDNISKLAHHNSAELIAKEVLKLSKYQLKK